MSTIRFHRSLYFLDAVAEAVAVFAEHGEFKLDNSGSDYIEVEVETPDPNHSQALIGAFSNYVLGASVHTHQQQAG